MLIEPIYSCYPEINLSALQSSAHFLLTMFLAFDFYCPIVTIDSVVKKKTIDLHLSGLGRNEIARILNGQKMRISEATITHLIQVWKRQHENSNPELSSQLNKSNQGQVQDQYQMSVSSIPQKEQQQEDKTQEIYPVSLKRNNVRV